MSQLDFDFVYTNAEGDFKTVGIDVNVSKAGKLEIGISADEAIEEGDILRMVEDLQAHRLKKMGVDLIREADISLMVKDEKSRQITLNKES